MARPIRVFDGVFGRLQLIEATSGEAAQAVAAPRLVIKHAGGDISFKADGETLQLTRENLLFLNPGVVCEAQPAASAGFRAASIRRPSSGRPTRCFAPREARPSCPTGATGSVRRRPRIRGRDTGR